MVDEVR